MTRASQPTPAATANRCSVGGGHGRVGRIDQRRRAEVDRAPLGAAEGFDRPARAVRDPEGVRQDVPGPGRDDRERDPGPGQVPGQRGDRAITADGDDEPGPGGHRPTTGRIDRCPILDVDDECRPAGGRLRPRLDLGADAPRARRRPKARRPRVDDDDDRAIGPARVERRTGHDRVATRMARVAPGPIGSSS